MYGIYLPTFMVDFYSQIVRFIYHTIHGSPAGSKISTFQPDVVAFRCCFPWGPRAFRIPVCMLNPSGLEIPQP